MRCTIEVKHVGPKAHVRELIQSLADRLDDKLQHLAPESVSLRVVFDENGTHALYRAAVTCYIPRHVVSAHEESREAGVAIRKAFAEVKRQLDKPLAAFRRESFRKHPRRLSKQHSLA